jgi:predicted nucleic acid-binding protein
VEIVDTVYLVAYLNPDDPRHEKALELINNLGMKRRISQAALIELDLLMKSRGFSPDERKRVWSIMEQIIPTDSIEVLVPLDFFIATSLYEEKGLDYFDALVAAQCIVRDAFPVTTDADILGTVKEYKAFKFQGKEVS